MSGYFALPDVFSDACGYIPRSFSLEYADSPRSVTNAGVVPRQGRSLRCLPVNKHSISNPIGPRLRKLLIADPHMPEIAQPYLQTSHRQLTVSAAKKHQNERLKS